MASLSVLTALTRKKNIPAGFQSVEGSRGWYPLVQEGFVGAWQKNIVCRTEDVLGYAPVFRCITLIASDIAKLRIKLIELSGDGIWTETTNPAYSPVLRKPNHFQTRQQFVEYWQACKLIYGNAYILKQRNNRGGSARGNVVALYVLDPRRVQVKVAPDSALYYALSSDPLSRLDQAVVVPASEIIHDRTPTLYHPLCGISPLTACGSPAAQGLRVQSQSTSFFANGSQPSGVLSTAQDIDDEQARAIQQRWQEQFTGDNAGKVAVLGLDLKYAPMMMSAVDAQLIEQLKWTAESVCTAFGVPPYMIGVGPTPPYNNVEALNQQYYSQALQAPIEAMESVLDEGLELPNDLGTECDLDGLLRMDTSTRMVAAEKALSGGLAMNEVRKRYHGVKPVDGGDIPYIQEQNWPISLLSQREVPERPPTPPADTTPPSSAPDEDDEPTKVLSFEAYLSRRVAGMAVKNAQAEMPEAV